MYVIDGSSIESEVKRLGGTYAGPMEDGAGWCTAILYDESSLIKLYDLFEQLDLEYKKVDKISGKFVVKFRTREYPAIEPSNSKVSKYRVSVGDTFRNASSSQTKEFLVRFVDAAFVVKAEDAKSAAQLAYKKYRTLD